MGYNALRLPVAQIAANLWTITKQSPPMAAGNTELPSKQSRPGETQDTLPTPHQSTARTEQNHKQRNLANQRNFRSRRKEYVLELEQKVRDYEREGVVATEKVQHAARSLQAENAALRQLIQQGLGWDAGAVDRYVAHAVMGGRVEPLLQPTTQFHAGPQLHIEPKCEDYDYATSRWQGSDYYGSSVPATSESTTPGDAMSCEDAATILAEFRAQAVDLELIKRELGCEPVNDCRCSISHGALFAKMADSM